MFSFRYDILTIARMLLTHRGLCRRLKLSKARTFLKKKQDRIAAKNAHAIAYLMADANERDIINRYFAARFEFQPLAG